CGDAAEIFWRGVPFHAVTHFCVWLDSTGCRFRDFVLRIRCLVRHDQISEGANLTRFRVNIDAEFPRSAHAFLGSGQQCVRDGFEQNLALNSALSLEIIQHCYKFSVHKNSLRPPDKKEWDTSSHSNVARSRVSQFNLLWLFVKMMGLARSPSTKPVIPSVSRGIR